MISYIGIVSKTHDSEYGVSFPDFPGCVTTGRTLDIAFEMAKEALQFHIDGLSVDGEILPAPSGYGDVMDTGDNIFGTFMIQIDIPSTLRKAA
jgi:predicted RNase H-like HicB family nuclease